ncbi:MAG: hypothetical protein R6W71_12820 [Bacteroidales bacterium]
MILISSTGLASRWDFDGMILISSTGLASRWDFDGMILFFYRAGVPMGL